MSGSLTYVTIFAALLVLGVLVAGLWNMARLNSSASLSQTLMRWRVGLQFIAIVIAMLALAVIKWGS
jgi:Mg2+ and Co2+ transporter CorA